MNQVESGDEDGKIEYILNFSEDINIKIKDGGVQTAIKAEESFSISVYPTNQNITVNEDNSLIIDTDYNNSYESNVSRFINLINFKINPDFTGDKSYAFYQKSMDWNLHIIIMKMMEKVSLSSYIIKKSLIRFWWWYNWWLLRWWQWWRF